MKAKVIKTAAEAAIKTLEEKTASAANQAAVIETVEEKETLEAEAVEETKKTRGRGRKAAAKTATKAATKAAGKRTAAKSAEGKTTGTRKKAEVKANLTVQFGGKSYSQEELMKIAKDVWKFDLKKKVGDLKSVELYVKPEENTCYYVMNDEIAGSFSL